MAMHEEFLGFEHLYDARIRTEDGFEFPIHRVLLAMRSEYFHEMLCNQDPNDRVILIPGIQGSTMEIVIDYIYTGKMNLAGHNIRDILVAAYFLGIEKLLHSSRILAVRSLTTSNSVPLYLAARKIENLGILEACSRYIVTNFGNIVLDATSRFQDLPPKSIEKFLALDNLNVSNERHVWEAIVCWMSKDPDLRKTFMKNLLPCLRMTEKDVELGSDILANPLVKENPLYDELEKIVSCRAPVSRHRVPKKLFVFTKLYISRSDFSEGIKVYLTYDEDIDIWRNISSKIFCPDVVLHVTGSIVMMFDTVMNNIFTLDIVSKQWSPSNPLLIPRREYNVVKLRNHIYVLGGLFPGEDSDEAITAMERFNSDSGNWEISKPHYALSQASAIAIDKFICIIGTISDFYSEFLVAQIYSPDTDKWQSIRPPRIYRRQFAIEVYKNRIFVLGGHSSDGFLKSVEVYNAEENTWENFEDLPFPYFLPKAVINKDILYVFDNHSSDVHDFRCPPVRWDDSNSKWEVVEASSPFCDLHIYQFCSIEDPEVILRMRPENRDPCTRWESSPFFTHV